MKHGYRVLIHQDAHDMAARYLRTLRDGGAMGGHLRRVLRDTRLEPLSVEDFLEQLVATKPPQIFAESAVHGDGTDWNQDELSILGDIVVAVAVMAYDNGRHRRPEVHPRPIPATLLFVPGALLANGRGPPPADEAEVTRDGQIDRDGYLRLYERRLLPALTYAHDTSTARGKRALITMPGLGCGQFAGRFKGRLGAVLDDTLVALLDRHGATLGGIAALYFDPYDECSNHESTIHTTKYMVRPLTLGNHDKPQLCTPESYAEAGDDFSDCDLYSVVAWDHVSWPGNDFYGGARSTDDGVKAAATSAMSTMTQVEGAYDPAAYKYQPPRPFQSWGDVVTERELRMAVAGNLTMYPKTTSR